MANSHADANEWFWHRRHAKAYCPIETTDGRVLMASVWHPEELADAGESDALVPVDELGLDHTDTTFDLVDSLRFLDDDTVAAVRETIDE